MTEEERKRAEDQELALAVPAPPPSVATVEEVRPEDAGDLDAWIGRTGALPTTQPEPAPAPAVSTVRAAATTPALVPARESYGDQVLGGLRATVPGLTASIGAMLAAKSQRTGSRPTGDILDASKAGLASQQQGLRREDADYGRRLAAARQSKIDQASAEDRARKNKREDQADAFTAEARDPTSAKSTLLREEIRKAYPQYADELGPDFEKMSVYDFANTPHPGIDKAKSDSAAERQARLLSQRGVQTIEVEKVRQEGRESLEDKRIAGRVKLKKTPKGGAGGGAGTPFDLDAALADLDKAYGGEGKAPVGEVRRMKLAASLPAAKRAAAVDRILAAAQGQKRQDERLGMAHDQADFKEQNAYQKASEGPEKVLEDLQRTRGLLKTYGVDMDHYAGQDIPGQGRVKSLLPQALLSDEGQQMRSQLQGNMATYLLELSGKAATDAERAEIKQIVGTAKGASTSTLIRGLHRLEEIAQAQKARAAANFRTAAETYELNRTKMSPSAPQNSPPAAGAPAGVIRVQLPDGSTSGFKGTPEEATAAGYKVL